MKEYRCEKCDMSIKMPTCAKCDEELLEKTVEKNGKRLSVDECPSCHGQIKSPQCCEEDMKCC